MPLADLITADRIRLGVAIGTQDEAVRLLADLLAADAPGSAEEVYEALVSREELGPTAIGKGVALPHALMDEATKPIAAMITLRKPVDFEASDDLPVDIVIGVLAPAHGGDLSVLGQIVKDLRKEEILRGIRTARTAADAYAVLQAPS